MSKPRTLLDKLWDAHVVSRRVGFPDVLYIDLHLVHEVTSPQAFATLHERGLKVQSPWRTLATMDHSTPTTPNAGASLTPDARAQLEALAANCARHGIDVHALGSRHNGIAHVIAPELGRIRPGMTVVCGDSHTSTHGAFGALAFGIGTTEVAHVLATQCLAQRRPAAMRVRFLGMPGKGVTAKDLALELVKRLTPQGGVGHVLEFDGPAVSAMNMEARMTMCNMSIEAGARGALVAPDNTTCAFLGEAEGAFKCWRSDPDAPFAKEVSIDIADLAPQATWGTHPGMAAPVDGEIPSPKNASEAQAQRYMGLTAGTPLRAVKVNHVFLGSCTNSRLSDLRAAAGLLRGRRVAPHVRMLVVPGSQQVKRAAEQEGLHEVFLAAGALWREPGCSMCIAMNGDSVGPGEYCVSTSNRNFEGRQGRGARTILASPLTAAASAVAGRLEDPRAYIEENCHAF